MQYDHAPEAGLNAEVNALVAANGEKYYRAMLFLYIDRTKALHPLHLKSDSHLVPETFPFGI